MSKETFLSILDWAAYAYVLTTAICVVVLVVFGAFRRTRAFAANVIYCGSFIIGGSLWIVSAFLTYAYWGLGWLIGGIVFLGVGVLPLALVATGIAGDWNNFWGLIIMFGLIVAFRLGAFYMLTTLEVRRAQLDSF